MSRRALAAASTIVALVSLARGARADEFTRTVDNAYPFTLPELSRERASVFLESTYASLTAVRSTPRRGSVWIERMRLESPFYKHSWYVGAEYAFFSGLASASDTEGLSFLSGNTRVHVRGVWSTYDGLAFGATFAGTLPTAEYGSVPGARVANDAIALSPQSINTLRPIDVGLAALVDARLPVGPITFQARHGFEWGANPKVIDRSQIAIVTTLFVGGLIDRNLSVGVEGEQLYLLDEGIPDTQRLSVVTRLGITWDFSRIIVGACAFSTIGTPFAREADNAFGGILRLGWTWDTRPLQRIPLPRFSATP